MQVLVEFGVLFFQSLELTFVSIEIVGIARILIVVVADSTGFVGLVLLLLGGALALSDLGSNILRAGLFLFAVSRVDNIEATGKKVIDVHLGKSILLLDLLRVWLLVIFGIAAAGALSLALVVEVVALLDLGRGLASLQSIFEMFLLKLLRGFFCAGHGE